MNPNLWSENGVRSPPYRGLVRRLTSRAATAVPRRVQDLRSRRFASRLAGPKIMKAFAEAFPNAVFVEIGANDGQQEDHLRQIIFSHRWKGVMVEPVPYVFERLRANYKGVPEVRLENSAVADRDGWLPFYHLAASPDYQREGLPQWYDGIGSFSRDFVLAHERLIPDIATRLIETRVPCLTFNSLCTKYELDHVDLLLLDTEGYDYELLRHIDLRLHSPALVVYEHYHLSRSDRVHSRALMRGLGYDTLVEGFDTWCLRAGADERLTRTWRRLRPAVPELCLEDEVR